MEWKSEDNQPLNNDLCYNLSWHGSIGTHNYYTPNLQKKNVWSVDADLDKLFFGIKWYLTFKYYQIVCSLRSSFLFWEGYDGSNKLHQYDNRKF